MRPDIKVWNPENPAQWNKTLAWTTVWLSTFSLTLGFCAWFLVLGPVSRPEIKRNRLFAHPQPALLACCYGGSFRRYAAYFVDFLTPDSRYQNSCHTLNGFAFNPALLLGIRGPAS